MTEDTYEQALRRATAYHKFMDKRKAEIGLQVILSGQDPFIYGMCGFCETFQNDSFKLLTSGYCPRRKTKDEEGVNTNCVECERQDYEDCKIYKHRGLEIVK